MHRFPDQPFFRQSSIQRIMTDILFIWSKLNPDVSYRQGMHELVAPILSVVHTDAQKYSESPDLGYILCKDYVEHDAWMMFHRIMRPAKEWFQLESGSEWEAKPSSHKEAKMVSDSFSSSTQDFPIFDCV